MVLSLRPLFLKKIASIIYFAHFIEMAIFNQDKILKVDIFSNKYALTMLQCSFNRGESGER
jgi:hypothetical protein